MNSTPARVAAIIGLLIVVLIGALVITQSLQSGTWQVQLVPAPESADASIPSTGLVPAARRGSSTVFAGYSGVPAGARIHNFLQDGIEANVRWSSVRDYSITVTTATIAVWTNPSATGCTAASGQCGHLSIAFPSSGPPGRPDFIAIDGGAEVAVDAAAWHSQPGSLDLFQNEYHVVATNSPLVPVGVPVVVRWLPWDGTGAPPLPTQ